MSIFNKKIKDSSYNDDYDNGFYGGVTDDGVLDDEDDELVPPAPAATPAKKKTNGGAGALKVVKPRDAQDGLTIADYLMHGYTVVMNIESLEREITIRLIDFLQGALHVLDGELRRVTKTTFVLSPRKGEVTEDGDGAEDSRAEDYM